MSVVELLLSKGANPNDKNNCCNSAILCASRRGSAIVVELLLSKGANPHDKSNDGFSPIIWASSQGHVNIVELLLSKGANPNDKNNYGHSPIKYASDEGHASVVELLLSKGADIPNDFINDIFSKWPISMAIIVLQELSLYYHLDASTIIDLYQYIGALEDY